MSLRRSSRIADTSTPVVPAQNPSKSLAKHTKVSKPSSTTTSSKKRKPTAPTPSSPTQHDDSAIPVTPLAKKPKAHVQLESPILAPPFTPTPSAIALLTSTNPCVPTHPPDALSRPAEPRATNAPLAMPNGSHVVAYHSSPVKPGDATPVQKRKAKEVVPPDVGAMKPATTNVDTLLKEAEAFLISVDPKFRALVDKFTCKEFSPEGLRQVIDPFTSLASGIIGQQVSGQAAASIRKKFTALFQDTFPAFPSPAQVLTKDLPTLRTAGLSQRKAEYIFGLAEKFASGELTASMLISASDEELIEKLVAVRGLGRWSVEMFACFGLKRMDVFSTGDLGVQRGMATYVGRDTSKLKRKGGKWKSLFMWYMWRIEDVDLGVLQQ
ncbi:3-methyladenine DNA glycosylase [Pleosporales sp. CAS-2024a]